MAQSIERPPGVREVMGSIPVWDSDIFFVPRSSHVDQFYFHLYLLIPTEQMFVTCFIVVAQFGQEQFYISNSRLTSLIFRELIHWFPALSLSSDELW